MLPTHAARRRVADPCTMVIFGVAGDLAKRKLFPALYNLAKAGLLSREFAVVGVAHSPMSNEDFRKKISAGHQRIHQRRRWTRKSGSGLFARLSLCDRRFRDKNVYAKLKDI